MTKPEAEAVIKSGRVVRRTAADGENDSGKAPAEASAVTQDSFGAESAGDKEAVFTDTDSGEVSYSENIPVMEDDDTYDYVGYVNGMSERAEVEAERRPRNTTASPRCRRICRIPASPVR